MRSTLVCDRRLRAHHGQFVEVAGKPADAAYDGGAGPQSLTALKTHADGHAVNLKCVTGEIKKAGNLVPKQPVAHTKRLQKESCCIIRGRRRSPARR